MKDYSQNGEQAHILHYLDTIGITKGHLVDLGAGDGYTMSNTRALLERGWSGYLLDGDPRGAKDVQQAWITKNTFVPPCDFLNIDLDGNDHHILNGILEKHKPALIVAEINPIFERNDAVVMPYNEAHVWDGSTYYGMSLAACERLGNAHGYTLAYLHAGINAFLLRNDMAEAHPDLLRPIDYRKKCDHRLHDQRLPWITLN